MDKLEQRFFSKVEKTETCWNWVAGTDKGYGVFDLKGKKVGAHRASWIINIGQIPEGKQVNHKCRNLICVNPDHLYIGTQKDNVRDQIKDGTISRGEGRPATSLRDSDIPEIRRLISRYVYQFIIAELYGVTRSVICNINRGRTWRHL